jgi:outer membrane protein assembly factor BamC
MNPGCLTLSLVLLTTGCGWATYNRSEQYINATTIDRVRIPVGLDQPVFEDLLEIPEARDVRALAGEKLEIGLPEPLASAFTVDQIVIKRLGDSRWVFIDAPPAMVWPRLRQFWADANMNLAYADPSRGVMETEWMVGRDGDAAAIFESFKSMTVFSNSGTSMRHKFRLRVEPGIRAGSTEVYLEHKSLPLGVPVLEDAVAWSTDSDNPELEGVALNSLAFYLGDHINSSTQVSKLAALIGGERAELVPDRDRPVLKYRLKFDRAWATVGNALEDARINVEDLDRNSAIYYVYYDESRADEPGFFSRLFTREAEMAEGSANRYLVHLDSQEGEVHVTVLKDRATLANALVAEKLLKIIKQYST